VSLSEVSERERERATAVRAVREACALCEAVAADMTGGAMRKPDRSPVTVADLAGQALICRALAEAFPTDPVMAEEDSSALRQEALADQLERIVHHVREFVPSAGTAQVLAWIDRGGLRTNADRFWVLDPIDGTKGFLRGDQYAVALALVEDGRPVLAVLGCPRLSCPAGGAVNGTLFVAARGGGATHRPLWRTDPPLPARVSGTADILRARMCEPLEPAHASHGAAARLAQHLRMRRPPARLDSQAKYGVVACGDGDVYLRLPRLPARFENLWDHAAGALLVQEAGGSVTDARGRPLDMSRGPALVANEGVLVTNGLLHAAVLEAIAELRLLDEAASA